VLCGGYICKDCDPEPAMCECCLEFVCALCGGAMGVGVEEQREGSVAMCLPCKQAYAARQREDSMARWARKRRA
jgi:hypothetical protein